MYQYYNITKQDVLEMNVDLSDTISVRWPDDDVFELFFNLKTEI